MNLNKVTASLVGVGLLASGLLFTGNSLALWNETASTGSTTINSGRLDISAGNSLKWYDISNAAGTKVTPTNRAAITVAANEIPSSTIMTPGDTFASDQPVDVTAVGRNLKATVSLSPTVTGALANATQGVTIETRVHNAAGTVVASSTSGSVTVNFASPEFQAKVGAANVPAGTIISTNTANSPDLYVSVVAYFDRATSGSTREVSPVIITPGDISITQSR